MRRERPWAVAVIVLLVGWSLARALATGGAIANSAGWPMVRAFAVAALHPNLSAPLVRLALTSAAVTIAFAVVGTAAACVVGSVGGVLSSSVWWRAIGGHRAALGIWRGLLAIPRSLHEVVWGLLLVSCLGLTPLTAILALAIHYGAITARITGETLDDTSPQTFDALRASGAGPVAALGYGLVPAAAPDLIAYGFYRFECAIRAAIVLGMIGAGGLGFQVLLSMQSLRYGEVWTFLYALILVCGVSDAWSGTVRRGRFVRASLVIGAGLLVWSVWYLRVDVSRLASPRTYRLLFGNLRDAIPPRFTGASAGELLRLSGDTLAMSVLALVLAFVAGLAVAVVAARGGRFSRTASRALLLVSRAGSAPVWTLIALFVLFPGTLPGVVGLALFNFGVLGRLLADAIEELDPAPIAALDALGARPTRVVLYAVLPALRPRALTLAAYRWEECLRGTVLVGIVGAGGLGTLLTEQLGRFDYRGVFATLLAFVVLTVSAEWAVRASRPSVPLRDDIEPRHAPRPRPG